MRCPWKLLLLLAILIPACTPGSQQAAPAGLVRLLLVRAQPPALLWMKEHLSGVESETPLKLPPGCALSGSYPSPEGERLLVELSCSYGPTAALVDLAGGELDVFIEDRSIDSHFLSWSANGESAYLRVGSMTEPRILRVEAASGQAQHLALPAYTYDMAPAPAPQADHMLFSFSNGLGLGSELWTAELGGQEARPLLVEPEHIIGFARPSPSADQLVYIQIPDSQVAFSTGELWLLDVSSGETRRLAQADAGHGYAAAWSPDGRQVAFVVRSNPEEARADSSIEALVSNLAIVDIASGGVRQVTHFEQGRATTPLWSPDGNTLIFAYVLDGRMDVQIADPTGAQQPSVILMDACCPAWMRK